MIVRDEEKMLGQCLKSVRELAEEIIVLDTGSEDNTVSVAKNFGAKVFHFTWRNDFSAARNKALEYCTHDWVFQIDADEILLKASVPFLNKAMSDPWTLVFFVNIDNGPAYCNRFYRSGRLFRNHPDIRYSRTYHETIQRSVDDMIAAEKRWRIVYEEKIVLRHYGYDEVCMRERDKLYRELRSIESYLENNPDDQPMAIRLAELYNSCGRHDEAIAVCSTVIATDPRHAAAYHILGMAYYQRGRPVDAMTHFKKGLSFDPNLPWIHYHLGSVYSDQGQFDEAIAHLREAIRLEPDLAKAHISLGVVYHNKGMLDKAVKHYHLALGIDPGDWEAHFNLGILFRRRGMLDEAIGEYRKALSANPQLAEAHNNLAVVYYLNGDRDMALKHCKKAIQLGFDVHPRFLEDIEVARSAQK
jgi:tetratricopeptide (TPR) repeat protein